MPNLQRLIIYSLPSDFDPQLLKNELKNLTSLELYSDEYTIPILNIIGAKLNELAIIDCKIQENVVQKVFELCASLECFSFVNYCTHTDLPSPEDVENSKLRKLIWNGSFKPCVLKAPLLEDVVFKSNWFDDREDIIVLTNWLAMETVLRHLTKFELTPSFPEEIDKQLHEDLEKLAKHIICFCPKLKSAYFDFSDLSDDTLYNTEMNSPITRFLDLVKQL